MTRKPEYFGPVSYRSDAEMNELWHAYGSERSHEIRDVLIEHYQPLVYQTAERMAGKLPSFVDINDLIGAGNLGLIDAIDKFEPERGIKFSTYCCTRISGAILDELRRLDWAPRLVRSRVNQLERARDEMTMTLGRQPSDEEVAQALEMDMKEYDALLRETNVKQIVSLDRKWDEDDDRELGQKEMLADPNAVNPLSELERAEIKEVAIKGLSEKEQKVLVMYYFDHMSLKEIGMALDLSESRVCQIHASLLSFLKDKFEQRRLNPTPVEE